MNRTKRPGSFPRWLLVGALLVASLAARPAAAAIISVEIATTIAGVTSATHTLPMSIGDDVFISFSYDDTVPDTNLTVGDGEFDDALVAFSVSFPDSGLSWALDGGFSTIITTDNTAGGMVDTFAVAGQAVGNLLDGDPVTGFVFAIGQGVIGASPTLVVDDLLNPPFEFGGLASSLITLVGSGYSDIFTLGAGTGEVVVPEPASASLLCVALLGAGALLRRRR